MQCVCDEFTHFIGIYWLFSVVSRVRFQLWHVLHLYRIVSSSVYRDTYHSLCIGDIPVYHFSPIRHGVNNISHVCWSDGKLMTKFKFKFDTEKDTSGRVHVMDQTVETGPWWGCQVFLVTSWIIPSYGLGRIWRKTNTNANHMMIWNHSTNGYCHTSNISCTLEGNKIVDHRDVIGASPVDAATTTSPFLTWHLVSMDWAKTTARREKNINVLWFGVPYIRGLTVVTNRIQHKYNLAGLLRKMGLLIFLSISKIGFHLVSITTMILKTSLLLITEGLVQDCSISIASTLETLSPALSHRYESNICAKGQQQQYCKSLKISLSSPSNLG